MTKTIDGAGAPATTPPSKADSKHRLYEMVVQALRAEILRGLHPVGTALPSEAVLVSRFNVSRHTVREAIRQLRDLGLVESRQGYGTTVTQPGGAQHYIHRVDSISDLHDFGVESHYAGETARLVKASPAQAERLGGAAGASWLRIEGTRYALGQQEPICEVEIFVAAQFAGVGRLLGRQAGPVYALIEAIYGESIAEVEQSIRAFRLPAASETLRLAAGETVVEITRFYRTLTGETAEVTFNRYPADRFSMSMHLRKVRG